MELLTQEILNEIQEKLNQHTCPFCGKQNAIRLTLEEKENSQRKVLFVGGICCNDNYKYIVANIEKNYYC